MRGFFVAACAALCCVQAFAAESHNKQDFGLSVYEPNTVGYTKDADDVGFMDFSISIKYEMFPRLMASKLDGNELYFAFSGRFGQYIGTRDSSPVVGKRFSPRLFWRHLTDWRTTRFEASDSLFTNYAREPQGYIDFGYVHESNGQSIDSLDELIQARTTVKDPKFANDNLSRGWDYLEVDWKRVPLDRQRHKLSTYLKLKYFLSHGLLQGAPEEYQSFENDPEGKPRKAVHGIGAIAKYQFAFGNPDALSDLKLALLYDTGYQNPFKNNSLRFEIGTKVAQLPVTFWAQNGYLSDLALYYKKVTSWGIAIDIGSF